MSTLKQRINLTGFITVFTLQTGFYKSVRFNIPLIGEKIKGEKNDAYYFCILPVAYCLLIFQLIFSPVKNFCQSSSILPFNTRGNLCCPPSFPFAFIKSIKLFSDITSTITSFNACLRSTS